MNEPPSLTDKKLLRKEDILKAAAEVFDEKGYSATSLNEIAVRMGSTKGKLYYYYSSKYELYLDVHISTLRSMTDRCREAANLKGEVTEKIWIMVYTHAMAILEGSPLLRVAIQGLDRYMMRQDDTPMDRVVRRLIGLRAEFEQLYIDMIADGAKQQVFPATTDASLAAKWVLGMVNWMVIWAKPNKRTKRSKTEVASAAADFALSGLLGAAKDSMSAASKPGLRR